MKKYLSLDVARIICAFMIMSIHIYPLALFNETLDYTFTRIIFRVAVPLFLMITGYYILPKSLESIKSLKKYTIKILRLYGISILIYVPINIYNGYFENTNLIILIKDIFFNGFFYHLWYFPSLILGLWLVFLLLKRIHIKQVNIIVTCLYIIGLFGDSYYGLIDNIEIIRLLYDGIFMVFDYTRNGLFLVPIFLYMGYIFNNLNNKIDTKINISLIIFFLILIVIEGLILYHFNIPRHNSMYIFLVPLMFCLFNFLIHHNYSCHKNIRSMANYIYIIHPLLIIIIRLISKMLHLQIIANNNFILFILVSILILILTLLMEKIKEVLKNERRFNER